ncbi:MAG: hypothetical protein M1133_08480 [Armatimonadetes bacterium]|nr:hypothetical protein [Armatimonadota bacterium]
MVRRFASVCAITVMFLAQSLLAADNDNLPLLKTKVKTLAAFKNGLGFVYRSGETPLKDGWAAMDEIPAAALGTLWIGAAGVAGRVEEVVSYKGTSQQQTDATSLADLLEANIGKHVGFTFNDSSSERRKSVVGVIEKVGPGSDDIVLVRGDDAHMIAVRKNDIRMVELMDIDAQTKVKRNQEVRGAKVRVGGKPSSAEITLAYLEKGITWSPSYLVNIKDDEKADITLEAVLASDVEDLEDTEVSFVVGYPNFMFANALTPLLVQRSVGAFVEGLMTGSPVDSRRERGGYGGMMAQSMAYAADARPYDLMANWNPESSYATAKPMPGESNEDLYFYRQPHVTLKKGDRARYTVFTSKVPYEHVYQWEVPDSSNLDDRGYRQDNNRQTEVADQVWHALRLENVSDQPWTTAPAFTVNASMPVAQDMLKYTPRGGKNTLKLTVATDVRAEQTQTEASRELVKIGYNEYDDVKADGTLTIKNFKQKAIRVNVKKLLTGEVLQTSEDGKVSKVARRLAAVNPQS